MAVVSAMCYLSLPVIAPKNKIAYRPELNRMMIWSDNCIPRMCTQAWRHSISCGGVLPFSSSHQCGPLPLSSLSLSFLDHETCAGVFGYAGFNHCKIKWDGHWTHCAESLLASCIECQMHKLSDGLVSGRYSCLRCTNVDTALQNSLTSATAANASWPVFQEGLRPIMFKTLIRHGHIEFVTMQQQDSEFMHLVTSLWHYAHAHLCDGNSSGSRGEGGNPGPEPTEMFVFALEQCLQCTACNTALTHTAY
jgi:hypothetical protein